MIKFFAFWVTCFILLSVSTALIDNAPASANDQSRLGAIIAVVRYNKLNIDDTVYKGTIDRVYNNGKFYSSKPPLLNIFTGQIIKTSFTLYKKTLLNNDIAIYKMSTFIIVVIPYLLIYITSFFYIFKFLNIGYYKSILYSLFLMGGTLLFTYSSSLNNHIITSLFFVFCFIILSINKLRYKHLVTLGFLLSVIFALDETVGLVTMASIYGFVFYQIWYTTYNLKTVALALSKITIAMIPVLGLHFYFNYLQFNTIFPPQMFPERYLNYSGSRWFNHDGARENLHENLFLRIFNYTFGTYGFFLYQPILILSILNRNFYRRNIFVVFIILFILYLLFNAILQPNYGGSSFGPRRFLPFVTIFYFYLVEHLKNYLNFNIQKKFFVLVLFVFTFIVSAVGYYNPWQTWNLFDDATGKYLYFPLLYNLKLFVAAVARL